MEEAVVTPKTRIVRISFSDPHATDSSSDEDEPAADRLKKKTYKIALQIHLHQEQQPLASDSVPIRKQLSKSTSGKQNLPGVRMRRSGRFSSEIRDPFAKKRIWLGTFATAEAASEAYRSRKREIDERMKRKTGDNSSAGDSSMELEGEEEVAPVGGTKVLEEEESRFGFLNGVQVIDSHGFLVGEFSKIDDLSISWGEDDDVVSSPH